MIFSARAGRLPRLFSGLRNRIAKSPRLVIRRLNSEKVPTAEKVKLVDSLGTVNAARIFASKRMNPQMIIRILNKMFKDEDSKLFVRVLMRQLEYENPVRYNEIKHGILI